MHEWSGYAKSSEYHPLLRQVYARKAAVNQVLAGGATPHFIKEFLGHENLRMNRVLNTPGMEHLIVKRKH